jgi:hypothetical protein
MRLIRPVPNTNDPVLLLFFKDIKYTFTNVLLTTFECINSLPKAIVESMTNGNWTQISLPGVVQLDYQCCYQENNAFKTTFTYQAGESSELTVYQDLLGERITELNKW